jgi:hypothetical protein
VRVKEELVVRKDAREKTETVRDTARRTKVEVDRAAAGAKPGAALDPDHDRSLGEKIADKAHDLKEGARDAMTPRKKL